MSIMIETQPLPYNKTTEGVGETGDRVFKNGTLYIPFIVFF